ncbi:MAG: BatA domain-containing protein [Bacteroidia bacterium]|nr:BatA domain-containing protein [Bacteroidia bacterium]
MTFLYPSYLWALLGLIVPLAIHLWSKKEGKTIKIGSIKLLSEADSKQSRSIKLNEYWLLLLRMLSVALLVFILAEPGFIKKTPTNPLTYIVEAALLEDRKFAAIIDSLKDSDAEIKLLSEGFPEFEKKDEKKDPAIPNYWQLALDMEQLNSDSVVVFTRGLTTGIKGMRPTIKQNIEWIVLDSGKENKVPFQALQLNDSIQIEYVESNSHSLSFTKEMASNEIELTETKDSILINYKDRQNKLPLVPNEDIKVLLVNDPDLSDEAKYIKASLKALSIHLKKNIEIVTQIPSDNNLSIFDYLVWLSSDEIPKEENITRIVFKEDDLASGLIVPGQSRNIFNLTTRLNSENIIKEHLPENLLSIIEMDSGLEKKIKSFDLRQLDKNELTPVSSKEISQETEPKFLSIVNWLWILLLPILIIERILSHVRKQ